MHSYFAEPCQFLTIKSICAVRPMDMSGNLKCGLLTIDGAAMLIIHTTSDLLML